MNTGKRLLALAALCAVLISSMAFSSPASAKMKVVTTFTVLADMAANVAGDAAEIVSITKPGAEIHGYEPTPRDIVRASGADLVLWNGMNLELWFEQFLSHLDGKPSATLTDGIVPIPIATGAYEGKPNPHAWMGLNNALIYIDNIVEAFAEQDNVVGMFAGLNVTCRNVIEHGISGHMIQCLVFGDALAGFADN